MSNRYEECEVGDLNVEIDDVVRSFDFPRTYEGKHFGRQLEGDDACYIEGVVEKVCTSDNPDIVGEGMDTRRFSANYKIKVTKKIFGGKEMPNNIGHYVYPPVNGLLNWLSDAKTNGVEKIA